MKRETKRTAAGVALTAALVAGLLWAPAKATWDELVPVAEFDGGCVSGTMAGRGHVVVYKHRAEMLDPTGSLVKLYGGGWACFSASGAASAPVEP